VVHVPVGPAAVVPKDELLPYMGGFAEWMAADWREQWLPDVALRSNRQGAASCLSPSLQSR